MLSPALLKDSLTRRTSFRERKSPAPRRRAVSSVEDLDPSPSSLGVREDRRANSTVGRRCSVPTFPSLEALRNKELNLSTAYEVDVLITDHNDVIIVPHDNNSTSNMILCRGIEDSQSRGRRSSMATGIFDISSRGGTSESKRRQSKDCGNMLRRVSTFHGHDIYPHQYTEDPTVAWEMLKTKRPVKLVRQMKPDSPIKSDHVRFVCVSCTHGVPMDPTSIPPGDVLIVAGDFTSCGLPDEIRAFNDNIGRLNHTFKIAIAGNHDCTFDDGFLKSSGKDIGEAKEIALKQALSAALSSAKISNPRSLLTNAIYLQDSMVELFGIRIYGTPWQPRFDNWAFNLTRGQPLLDKWNQIPTGVDVLITHTPPLGHGDMLSTGARVGCVELLNSIVKRIRPKYHVFGHIHEGYGCTSDGYTKFINCCLTNENLEMTNNAVIFDIPVNAEAKSHFLHNSKKFLKKLTKK